MGIVNKDKLESFITKDGSRIIDILSPLNSSIRNQSLGEAHLEPGGITARHIHAESEEIYYIIAGAGVMYIEGEEAQVKDGDAIIIPPGKEHRIRNTGEKELVFLCMCAPPYSHDDTELTNQ